jgi:type I restriction enzyme S subunit
VSTDVPPNGWRRVKFGDVVRKVNDRVDPDTGGIERYVAGEHMETDDLTIRRWGEVGDGYLGPAFHMRFKPGQVLYGSRRTYLRKVAVADFEGITANTTFVLEPSSKDLLPEFLPLVMTTEAFHEHSIKQSKGSVNPYINFSDLTWYEFALPPIDEQRRLVEILGASTELVERSRVALQSARSLMAAYAHDLCEREAERGNVTALVDVVEVDRPITYGILMPGPNVADGVPVIKVKDFPAGFVREDDLLRTSHEIDAAFARSRLRAGDLIISIRGTVGRVAEIGPALAGANITQDTARLTIRADHDARFVRAMLESGFVQTQISRRITGLAVKGINIGELRRVLVPAPPLEAQIDHATVLSALSRQIDTSMANLASAVTARFSLREAVLAEARVS